MSQTAPAPVREIRELPLHPLDCARLRAFRRDLEAELPGRIARVLLFGSRVRGEAEPVSDWDIAILLNGPRLSREEDATLSEIRRRHDADGDFQIVSFPIEDLAERTYFMRNLRREGAEIG